MDGIDNMNCKERIKADNGPCKHYIKHEKQNMAGYCALENKYRCIEAIKHYPLSLSHSTRMDWACKYKVYYRQILGLKVKPEHIPLPIKLGSCWDEAQKYLIERKIDNFDCSNDDLVDKFNEIGNKNLLNEVSFARFHALCRAYIELELNQKKEKSEFVEYQKLIEIELENSKTIGYIDRSYNDYFVETKLSSRPDFYRNLHSITSQVGTYFLGNPDYKHCIVEITRLPGQRTGNGKFEGESPEAFEERVFQDIVSRPSYYFIGFDRKKRTFGVKFWRKEFDLDKLKRTYEHIEREIKETIANDSWYENYNACHVPGQCFYYPICSTGVISEEIYEMREKGMNK